jgi:hypothetical protein
MAILAQLIQGIRHGVWRRDRSEFESNLSFFTIHGDRPFIPFQDPDQQYKLAEIVMSQVAWKFAKYLSSSQSCIG